MPLANELALSAAMTTPSLILMQTLLKDLRRSLRGGGTGRSIGNATRSRRWRTCFAPSCPKRRPLLTLGRSGPECGCAATRRAGRFAEVWEILLLGSDSPAPTQVQGEQDFGIRWDGDYEALSRLIFGLGSGFEDAAVGSGLTREAARELHAKLSPSLFELLFRGAHAYSRCGRSGAFSRGNDEWLVKFCVA